MLRLVLVLSLIVLVSPPTPAHGAACTVGTDCYADCVRGPDSGKPAGYKNAACQAKQVPVDTWAEHPQGPAPTLLVEDFEAPTLRLDENVGGGAPYWGPPYDHSNNPAHPCFRAGNSYWWKSYKAGTGGSIKIGEPPAPVRVGCQCAISSGQSCAMAHWHPTDLWQGNSRASIAILTDTEFALEVPTNGPPTHRAGGGAGAFDGAASLAHRILAGTGNTMGNGSGKMFDGPQRTIGITMAVAYPRNLVSSRIVANPWKHNEWGSRIGDTIFIFHRANGLTRYFPFDHGLFVTPTGTGARNMAVCNAARSGATWTKGHHACNDVILHFTAQSGDYSQPRHWPIGAWGCVRGHFQHLGLANTSIKIWFTGPDGEERSVIDVSNLDTRLFKVGRDNGYDRFMWNSYANANIPRASAGGTVETTFRYEDNVHIRAGAPVSCSQIGYGTRGRPGS